MVAQAQGLAYNPFLPGQPSPGGVGFQNWMSSLPSLPGLDALRQGDVKIWPSWKIGYKKLGFSFGLDIPPTQILSPFLAFPNYGTLLDTYPFDVRIKSANLAFGTIRVDTQIGPDVNFFGSVSANIPRTVGFEANVGPGIGQIPVQAWSWRGSRLQWSEFEIGGSCRILRDLAFVAGIKFGRTSFRFSDPEPMPSYGYPAIFPPPLHINTVNIANYSGDLNAFLTTPYIGCEILSSYFKGRLLVGTAAARLRLPLDLSHGGAYITLFGLPVGRRDISEQAEYTLAKSGLFLEGSVESTFPVTETINLTAWLKGSWLRVHGNGEVNLNGQSSLFVLIFTLPEPFSASSSGPSTLSQYDIDLGISGAINF